MDFAQNNKMEEPRAR